MAEKQNPNAREDRLKTALKANMAKRKAQARARAEKQNSGEAAGEDKNDG